MKADTLTAIAGFFSNPLLWYLCLDGVLILVLLALKMLLLAGIVILVSRNEAHRPKKFFAFTVIFLAILGALLNPSDEPAAILRGLLGCLFVSTLLIKKVCWIDIEKALLAAALYCTLSVAIDIYSAYGLDLLIAERTTIDRTLAARIDAQTRLSTGDDTLPSSPGVVAAMFQQASSAPDEGGIAHTLLSPFRAGMKAKETIDRVNKIATDQASAVNMLAGAGTNVGSRADELAALRNQLAAGPGAVTPPPVSVPQSVAKPKTPMAPATPPPPTPPAPAATAGSAPSDPGAALAKAIVDGIKKLPSPGGNGEQEPLKDNTPSPPAPKAEATSRESPGSMSSPAPTISGTAADGPEHGLPVGLVNTQILAKVSPAAREQWQAACASIRVSAAGRSANKAYVLINGQFVAVGSVFSHAFSGASFRFRLLSVNAHGQCAWEPVLEQATQEEANLIRF